MLHGLPPVLAAAAVALLPAYAPAQQEEPLSPVGGEPISLADDPFEITDPSATPPGEAEIAFVGSYTRARIGRVRDTGGLESELELGVLPSFTLRIGQEGAYGNLEVRRRLGFGTDVTTDGAERAYFGGSTRLGALYQLSEERGAVPALGLLGRVRTIYGPGRTAYEADTTALASKTIAGGQRPLAAHLNLGWVARIDPLPQERSNRFYVNASVGKTVTHDTALVATYAREQQEPGQRDFSLLQAGFRHRLPDGLAVVGFAAGVGFNRDSPRFALAFAVQWAFGGGP